MANEIQVSQSIMIANGNVTQQRTASFSATMNTAKGPTPGVVVATVTGVEIPLTELGDPGVAIMKNQSSLYRAIVGIKDTSSGVFYPLLEFKPGEEWHLRLSRLVGQELTGGSGTGTAGTGGVLWVKGVDGSVDFETLAYAD